MMMEASPAAALEMIQPELVLELLIVALDPPTQLGEADELGERGRLRQRREPILRGLRVLSRPLDQHPLLRPGRRALRIAMGGPPAQPREARAHRAARPFAPRDRPPGRRPRVGGRPRPFQRFGGCGASPGGQAVISFLTPTTYVRPAFVSASRNAVVSP